MTGWDPPGHEAPQPDYAGGGGAAPDRRLANHWKRWDAKPEAVARKTRAMLVRLHGIMANHRKRWDAKPEAKGRLRPTPVRLHAGKPPETAGRKTRG